MKYCMSPRADHTDGIPWFQPAHDERYCPAHRQQPKAPKPRVRVVDGRYVPVDHPKLSAG